MKPAIAVERPTSRDPIYETDDRQTTGIRLAPTGEPRWGRGAYAERSLDFQVEIGGRWRRVYAKPIGNVAVIYLKSMGETVYLSTMLEHYLTSVRWANGWKAMSLSFTEDRLWCEGEADA